MRNRTVHFRTSANSDNRCGKPNDRDYFAVVTFPVNCARCLQLIRIDQLQQKPPSTEVPVNPEFETRVLNVNGLDAAKKVATDFNGFLDRLKSYVPSGTYLERVKEKLEEASFLAKKAISIHPPFYQQPVTADSEVSADTFTEPSGLVDMNNIELNSAGLLGPPRTQHSISLARHLATIKVAGEMWPKGAKFCIRNLGDILAISLTYMEPDIHSGKIEKQVTREWLVNPFADRDTVARTAYKLLLGSLEHRLGENFTCDGVRAYDPHRKLSGV